MGTRTNDHAVVIGGSVAGLLTAQALSEHFGQVTVVERDHLPEHAEFRKGVPHARHLHAFWVGGLDAVKRMLPGIGQDLLAAGAQPLRLPTDMLWLTPADKWCHRFAPTQQLLSASRTLIEWSVRRRVLDSGRIRVLTEHDVAGLRLDRAGDVCGVEIRARRTDAAFHLDSDLVVDASGRGSRLPGWLAALGRPQPKETVVDAFLGYATRYFAIPPGTGGDWRSIFVQAAPPRHVRGGLLFPIEDDRWAVTVIGGGRDYPPTDEAGFLEFTRGLRSPALYEAIARAEPVSPVWGYRRTANHRRHYESLRGMPGRLLVIGDSLCAFNPVYGQGLTVAALQVEALSRTLYGSVGPALPTRQAQRAIAKVADGAWILATGEDLRYPTTEGASATAATRFTHRYMDRVLAATANSPQVNAAFLRVLNMIDKPAALFRPSVVAATLRKPARADLAGPPVQRAKETVLS